eukprot:109353-Chlamydomonas_euryale.AAC.1
MDGWIDGQADRPVDRWMGTRMDGWMDKWIGGPYWLSMGPPQCRWVGWGTMFNSFPGVQCVKCRVFRRGEEVPTHSSLFSTPPHT